MRDSFIVTLTLNAIPVIFRFEHTEEERYDVSIINKRTAEPFKLAKAGTEWIIDGTLPIDIANSKNQIIEAFTARLQL